MQEVWFHCGTNTAAEYKPTSKHDKPELVQAGLDLLIKQTRQSNSLAAGFGFQAGLVAHTEL